MLSSKEKEVDHTVESLRDSSTKKRTQAVKWFGVELKHINQETLNVVRTSFGIDTFSSGLH